MKIKLAVLHQNVSIPGIMAPNMYINKQKVPGLELKWMEKPANGLAWRFKSKQGEPREGFFPAATVSAVEVESGDIWAEKT